ncbi:MAG: TIGR02300 family protein [Alphaproteobacteria bacterium]|nr:TIGR02300 family protein [Alphaproteobacteria bacterium]
MVKAAWGTKRTCQGCGARFYDLNKDPITCPKCGQQHDPEDFVKARRSRSAAAAKAAVAPAPKKPKELIEGVPIGDDELPVVEGDTEEDAALEDTEDLAEDEAELEVEIEDKAGDEET